MTRPKPSYSTTNMQTPICTKLLACDGVNLVGDAARTRGYCAKCRDAMEKKATGPKVTPPRGENSALGGRNKWSGE